MSKKPPIQHVLVVGFHHKLGCQVEFSYPPLIAGSQGKNECPTGWKYLPTLALPDGSHNFVEDTVYFNLPSLVDPTESIFGISCYRQIPVEKLKLRTADLTRSTVQKSVCILSRLPIYGYIEVKLSLIANAFFDQGDFTCTDILVEAYNQLNACLMNEPRPLRHFYVGIPLREIILKWRHKILILFKLFLLQRRVIFFASPVHEMCCLILGVSSIIPRLLEKGFQEVACVRTSRPMSPMPDFTINSRNDNNEQDSLLQPSKMEGDCYDGNPKIFSYNEHSSSVDIDYEQLKISSNDATAFEGLCRSSSLTRESSLDNLATSLYILSSINPDEYRAPITVFANGNLCLPYLSLPYMDLLSDPSVLSYIIGTSNVLFQQKRNLADIQVDVESCTIETYDPELRRQLILTTEDLRFTDFLLRHVQSPREDAEGSENWIRQQFQGYMLALLRTAVLHENSKECEDFNSNFIATFKKTQCFQDWYDVRPDLNFFEHLPVGHPFSGTLSVLDMKLKLAQTMQNSESGRKINQAVNTTSRAVGGAISQAKGAFSNWWSSITMVPPTLSLHQSSTSLNLSNSDMESDKDNNHEGLDTNSSRSFQKHEFSCSEELEGIKTQQEVHGIVEIAKEAELLNTNTKNNTKNSGTIFVV